MSAPTSDGLVIAWDLYGTLLSTASIAKQLAEHVGDDKATSIAAEWRKYQLEYTWRLNSMGMYGLSILFQGRRKPHEGMNSWGYTLRVSAFKRPDRLLARHPITRDRRHTHPSTVSQSREPNGAASKAILKPLNFL